MTISELSVRRPVLITMVFVLICAIASIYLPNLEISLYPSVTMPMISVSVSCSDASPEEVEMQVAKVLEERLSSISGLESITTTSSSNNCNARLSFSYETDLDEAANDVSSALSSITRSLPSWAGTPSIMRFDSMGGSSTEILSMTITGPYGKEDLQTIATETATPLLKRVDGVADVSVRGVDSTTYSVILDPTILASYNLSLSEVSSALSSRNTQGSAGTLTTDKMNYTISMDARYRDLDEIRNTVVTNTNGIAIRVQDLGTVEKSSSANGSGTSYLNGEATVTLSISADSDATESTVANAVIAALPSINQQLPAGVSLEVTRNNTTMISSTMNEVYKSAIEGVILAAVVIFVFLRGIKTTLIITLSMPISILITLMVMSLAGITINSMSMAGLILGIGMIVDASICVLENSYTFREKGYKPAVAAILGSKRMFNAIFASTLTTICVFLPIMIFKADLGSMGMMFQDLILTVCISLTASLFVAVTIVPALFGPILKIDTRVQKPLRFFLFRFLDRTLSGFENLLRKGYTAVLSFSLNHRILVVLLLALILAFSLGFFTNIGMSLSPAMNTDDSINLSVSFPAGTIRDVTLEELFRVEKKIESTLPEGAWTSISVRTSGTNSGSMEIVLPDITEQKYSAQEVKNLILPLLNDNPEATWTTGGGRGPGSGSAIDVQIISSDSDATKEVANQIASIINQYVPEATNISQDIANGAPKYEIVVDEELASDMGISYSTILKTVQSALSSTKATSLNTFSTTTSYSLQVEVDSDQITNLDDLGALLISTRNGNIRLDSIATFEKGTSARSISRENKQRVNHVTASARDGVSQSVVQEKVNAALDEHLILPEGVTISQSGQMVEFQNMSSSIVKIVVIALVLVYAVMAAQFESLSDPFIIFASIPMLLIGVVAIHLLMNQDFSLYSIVGIVSLIGVVVNNGIVLVDAINFRVRQKVPVRDAILEVGAQRLRPILMTTLTTVLGMVPMAFFPGDGAEMMQPIALTFVGGMLTGAFMTLVLTPVLYSLINSRRERHYEDPNSLLNQLAEYDELIATDKTL